MTSCAWLSSSSQLVQHERTENLPVSSCRFLLPAAAYVVTLRLPWKWDSWTNMEASHSRTATTNQKAGSSQSRHSLWTCLRPVDLYIVFDLQSVLTSEGHDLAAIPDLSARHQSHCLPRTSLWQETVRQNSLTQEDRPPQWTTHRRCHHAGHVTTHRWGNCYSDCSPVAISWKHQSACSLVVSSLPLPSHNLALEPWLFVLSHQ